ncbi:hypothetical protein CCP3SC5AM1_450007 [Gammaproteobacteria bacterium]
MQNIERSRPPFPYDEKTQTIHLPKNIEDEIKHLVMMGNKVAAIQRVLELTGSGLRISKNYVDNFEKSGVIEKNGMIH